MARRNFVNPSTLIAMIVGIAAAMLWVLFVKVVGMSWFWGYLASINLITLALYGYDKSVSSVATRGPGVTKLRVPERMLHTLAFMGGSPAALLAQSLFRHKTQKIAFQLGYWLIVAVQVILIMLFWWMK